MRVKQVAKYNIGTVVALIAAAIFVFLTGDESLIGIIVDTEFREATVPSLEEAAEGEIITLRIGSDGDTIKHTAQLQLSGGIDFTGKKGDSIILQKQDGVWVEIGRRLVEMEAYE